MYSNDKEMRSFRNFILVGLICLVLYFIYKGVGYFFVNESLFVLNFHWAIAIASTVLFIVWTFKKESKFQEKFKNKPIRKWVFRILLLLVIPLLLADFLPIIATYPLHKLTVDKKRTYKITKYVKGKSNRRGFYRRYCVRFENESDDIVFGKKICGYEKLYKAVEKGDKVELLVYKSKFGANWIKLHFKSD